MNTVPDEELYGVITVNLGSLLQTDRLAFVDENNLARHRSLVEEEQWPHLRWAFL